MPAKKQILASVHPVIMHAVKFIMTHTPSLDVSTVGREAVETYTNEMEERNGGPFPPAGRLARGRQPKQWEREIGLERARLAIYLPVDLKARFDAVVYHQPPPNNLRTLVMERILLDWVLAHPMADAALTRAKLIGKHEGWWEDGDTLPTERKNPYL